MKISIISFSGQVSDSANTIVTCGEHLKRKEIYKRQFWNCRMMDMFIILIVTVVWEVCMYVKSHQIVHFKDV